MECPASGNFLTEALVTWGSFEPSEREQTKISVNTSVGGAGWGAAEPKYAHLQSLGTRRGRQDCERSRCIAEGKQDPRCYTCLRLRRWFHTARNIFQGFVPNCDAGQNHYFNLSHRYCRTTSHDRGTHDFFANIPVSPCKTGTLHTYYHIIYTWKPIKKKTLAVFTKDYGFRIFPKHSESFWKFRRSVA